MGTSVGGGGGSDDPFGNSDLTWVREGANFALHPDSVTRFEAGASGGLKAWTIESVVVGRKYRRPVPSNLRRNFERAEHRSQVRRKRRVDDDPDEASDGRFYVGPTPGTYRPPRRRRLTASDLVAANVNAPTIPARSDAPSSAICSVM